MCQALGTWRFAREWNQQDPRVDRSHSHACLSFIIFTIYVPFSKSYPNTAHSTILGSFTPPLPLCTLKQFCSKSDSSLLCNIAGIWSLLCECVCKYSILRRQWLIFFLIDVSTNRINFFPNHFFYFLILHASLLLKDFFLCSWNYDLV